MYVNRMVGLLKDIFVGKPRNLLDKRIFHKVSLIAVFAWVGLGADGLSSSCYGPEEAFKALGAHSVLAPLIALASVITIAVICASYSQIIELFPGGGGGYLVASKLISPTAGVVSGCALLVDYVLTIAISISSGGDALFSILPGYMLAYKVPAALIATLLLTLLNLRGVKESVLLWVPVFFIFLGTHAFAIVFTIITHLGNLPALAAGTGADFRNAHSELGIFGLFMLLIRAYSVGAGTFTGIEAVSNGLPILREPRVHTGKRTMLYMGLSLGTMVAGLLFAYLLCRVEPQSGKTLNAVLLEQITAHWPAGLGAAFVFTAMISAMALLFIAAQSGFLDGPRVLSNMAMDRWVPTRFASLSDRLVTQNGILLMGTAAALVILATGGSVGFIVVLYSINVFITFTLSQLGMVRHWWSSRAIEPKWKHKLIINSIGFCLTLFILAMLSILKFWEGGWITLFVTGVIVLIAYMIRGHYRRIERDLTRLRDLAKQFEKNALKSGQNTKCSSCERDGKTAVIFVNGFNGLGVHSLLTINRTFPDVFKNFIFVQAGVVDAGNFKGSAQIEKLREHISKETSRYVQCMRNLGYCSEAVTEIGTDIVDTAARLASEISEKFSQSVFFGGQLVFEKESWLTRLLHNYVVFALQRKLFRKGIPFLILPIRV